MVRKARNDCSAETQRRVKRLPQGTQGSANGAHRHSPADSGGRRERRADGPDAREPQHDVLLRRGRQQHVLAGRAQRSALARCGQTSHFDRPFAGRENVRARSGRQACAVHLDAGPQMEPRWTDAGFRCRGAYQHLQRGCGADRRCRDVRPCFLDNRASSSHALVSRIALLQACRKPSSLVDDENA